MKTNVTPRRVSKPSTASAGSGRFRSGSISQAAEQLVSAMARPAVDTAALRGMDAALIDFASALQVLEGGVRTFGKRLEDDMPAERALHEAIATLATQVQRVGIEAESIQVDQRRRNALDWERLDNPRPNEVGYDWGANQQ